MNSLSSDRAVYGNSLPARYFDRPGGGGDGSERTALRGTE
jgi:hypothetical protein